MKWPLILVDLAAWPVLQLTIAWVFTQLDHSHFVASPCIYRLRRWEPEFYRRWLRVRRWKALLPDGSSWVGGRFPKKRLQATNRLYLRRFAEETRRGEAAHWVMILCLPLFYFWNPLWACAVMTVYALAANLPCIVVQRYNRGVLLRCLSQR